MRLGPCKGVLVLSEFEYFPRVQEVVIPILRKHLPKDVMVTSWIPDIDHRVYPIINVRRVGGYRDNRMPKKLDLPIIEITAYGNESIEETEALYSRVLDILYEAKDKQEVVDTGHLSHVKETMGATQFSSLFQDTWRIQGLIQVGVRPAREDS